MNRNQIIGSFRKGKGRWISRAMLSHAKVRLELRRFSVGLLLSSEPDLCSAFHSKARWGSGYKGMRATITENSIVITNTVKLT